MKINVWGINYHPDQIGIAPYSTQLCEHLAGDEKHEVTMVTGFAYYPCWRKNPADKGLYRTDMLNGVKIVRCWKYVPPVPTVLRRIAHELSFVLFSFLRQLIEPAADVYIVVSPPLALGLAAAVLTFIKGAPFIFHVQDLQPDAAVSLGMMKDSVVIKAARLLEQIAYNRATLVSGISPQMCKVIAGKGVPSEKIYYLPNWVVKPDSLPASGTFKQAKGIDRQRPVITYAGNLGVKQRINSIVNAAKHLNGNHDALFVIAGDGGQRQKIEQAIKEFSLSNIMLLPILSESEHWSLLIDSDICLITEELGAGAAFFPSKLLKILACGRPVLTNAEAGSALYEAVKQGGFGECVIDSDGGGLSEGIISLLARTDARRSMSQAANKYVLSFERSRVLKLFSSRLTSLGSGILVKQESES